MLRSHVFDARRLATLLVACASFCAATSAHAQVTWSGAGANASWSTSGNWSTALGNNFSAALVFDGSNNLTNTNDRTSGTATSITFNAGAGAFTIGGEAITLGGNILNSTSFKQTINNNLIIAATRTLTGTIAGGEIVLAGNISGNGGLTGSGSAGSVITLSGNNTFGGNVSPGAQTKLNINGATALGSGTLSLRNIALGALDNTSGAAITLTNANSLVISDAGGIIFVGSNSLSFGNNVVSTSQPNPAITVSANKLTIGSLSNTNAGGGGFTKSGAGTLEILDAANANVTGTFTLTTGTLLLGNKNGLGAGTITLNGGTLQASANLSGSGNRLANNVNLSASSTVVGANSIEFGGTFFQDTANNRILTNNLGSSALLTLNAVEINRNTVANRSLTISGSGNTLIAGTISNGNGTTTNSLVINSTGITTFSGTSTYTGTTGVTAGTLVLRGTAAKGGGTVTAAVAGSIGLGVGGAGSYSSADVASLFANTLTGFSLNAASGVAVDTTAGDFTISDAMSGTRTFTKLGAGTLRLSATNTFTGPMTISTGTLEVSSAGRLAGTTGTYAGNMSVAAGTVFAHASSANSTLSGVISGAGGLVQSGAGTLTLRGANTYTGSTIVSAGTLALGAGGSLATSKTIVAGDASSSGAVLDLSALAGVGNTFTFAADQKVMGKGTIDLDGGTLRVLGTLAPGNSPGNLTIEGNLQWQPTDAGYQWEINDATGTAGTNWDLLTVTGALDLTSLNSTSKYLLDLTTLTSLNAAGSMANYVDGGSYTWSLASASSVLLGSGTAAAGTDITSLFNVSFANWANTTPSAGNYSIRVASSGQGIDLVIVPEPSTVIFAGIGIAMTGWSLWKRRRIARTLQK